VARGNPRVPEPFEIERTRVCVGCTLEKPWSEFSPKARDSDGHVTRVAGRCRECRNEYLRDRLRGMHQDRERMSGRPRIPQPREWRLTKRCPTCEQTKPWALFSPRTYWPDGSVRQVQSWCRECQGAANAKYHRVYDEAAAARNRRYLERVRRDRKPIRLPVGPLRAWLLGYFATGEEGIMEFSERIGVQDRSIRRILSEHEHVTDDLADRILLGNGVLLNELYPLDGERLAA